MISNVIKNYERIDFLSSYYFGTLANQEGFEDAEDECMRIGGHLPSISNAYQNSAVQNAAHRTSEIKAVLAAFFGITGVDWRDDDHARGLFQSWRDPVM
ncbi:hypothetical protein RB195_014571 [Necator americanus]|uniref:C-type lectin domain-containing protein n=1 Tax=Necator americanus TaxID=51031 RepID=A0ABR1E0U3_NECAM